MSDYIRDSITQFHSAIHKSYEELQKHTKPIEDRKAQMLALLQNSVSVPQPAGDTANARQEKGYYQQVCESMLENVDAQMKQWQTLLQKQINHAEFVNRHEKSLLTIVFADVNAGKSTMGNFISGYSLQGTAYADLYTRPTHYLIPDNQAEPVVSEIDFFEEDETEKTSTIQYFTLADGLTWVDTPGLHSLTIKNGELTKEYIQFADLVIFLTPSSSPLKSDEREMMKSLLEQGKVMILAVTKSDDTRPKVIDRKMIRIACPKSAENRKAQENYILEETSKLCKDKSQLENAHALSLSVKLARKAVQEQDEQLFRDSNLDEFFAQVEKTLSARAVELKMRRPKTEVNSFIDLLIEGSAQKCLGIRQLRQELAPKIAELEDLLENSQKEQETILRQLDMRLPNAMSLLLRNLRDRGKIGTPETVSQKMAEKITELAVKTCQEHFSELWKEKNLSLQLPSLEIDAAAGGGYKVNYLSQVVTREVERAPKGPLEHIIKFIDKEHKFYRIKTETEQIAMGDNFSTFLADKLEELEPQIHEYVSATVHHMADASICPLLDCYRGLDGQLDKLEKDLNCLRFQKNEI